MSPTSIESSDVSTDRLATFFECLAAADRGDLLREFDPSVLSGYSGTKLIAALQRFAAEFASDSEACYVEIGVFKGLTLLSVAAAVPEVACFGVDNFAFFDPDRNNLSIVESRRAALGASNATLINADFEDALQGLPRHIGQRRVAVYFIDGPHDYRSQLMCLEMALPYLHPDAVIVIDDCNYAHVRQANSDFLVTHPGFKLLFEVYTHCHPGNMEAEAHTQALQGWWNGVNVIVRDAADRLEPILPPTTRSRCLFEAEHVAHAAEIPDLAAETGHLLSAIHHSNPIRVAYELIRLKRMMRRRAGQYVDRFATMNTDSGHLATSRFSRLRA